VYVIAEKKTNETVHLIYDELSLKCNVNF